MGVEQGLCFVIDQSTVNSQHSVNVSTNIQQHRESAELLRPAYKRTCTENLLVHVPVIVLSNVYSSWIVDLVGVRGAGLVW